MMVQSLLGFNKDTYPLSPNLRSIFMGTDRAFIGPKDGSTSHTDAGIDHLRKIDSSRINPTGQLKQLGQGGKTHELEDAGLDLST
ncbi:hypothetical protein PtB15_14B427 [Puccinia triticina]|nr:hypothetical protein PtB15_14B427 [Puccinia triticina]